MPVNADRILERYRRICLALPNTKETLTWGEPHFRVGEKIFAGFGHEKGRLTVGFKLRMEHADARVQDPRFQRAAYVGHKGWVSLDATQITDWADVEGMVRESYCLIAPKKLARQVEAGEIPAVARSVRKTKAVAKRAAPKRSAPKKKPRASKKKK